MKKRLLILLLFTGLIVLALAGWSVQGVRWTVGGRWLRSGAALPEPA
jgi:hypothetical protein